MNNDENWIHCWLSALLLFLLGVLSRSMGCDDEFFTLCTSWSMAPTCYLCLLMCIPCDTLWFWITYFLCMMRFLCVDIIDYTVILVYLFIICSDDGDDSSSILYLDLLRDILHYIIFISWLSSVDWWCLSWAHYFGTHTTFYNILIRIWVLVAAVNLSLYGFDILEIGWAYRVLVIHFSSIS